MLKKADPFKFIILFALSFFNFSFSIELKIDPYNVKGLCSALKTEW